MQTTNDYSQFKFLGDNRVVNTRARQTQALISSMKRHGWIDAFPMLVKKNGSGFYVLDGQHRLEIAKDLNIPVKYVETVDDVDIAQINSASKSWNLDDYVHMYAARGVVDYITLQDFSRRYGIIVSASASILGGASPQAIRDGKFTVTNRADAEAFGDFCLKALSVEKTLSHRSAVLALWACWGVKYFQGKAFLRKLKSRAGTMQKLANVESYLELFESVYNHRQRHRKPLAFDAKEATKKRMGPRRP